MTILGIVSEQMLINWTVLKIILVVLLNCNPLVFFVWITVCKGCVAVTYSLMPNLLPKMKIFVSTNKKLFKNWNWTLPIVHYFTVTLKFVSYILVRIVSGNSILLVSCPSSPGLQISIGHRTMTDSNKCLADLKLFKSDIVSERKIKT